MPYETIEKARKGIRHEQEAARLIAEEQMKKTGFSRAAGFDPAPRARNPYRPEAERPSEPYKSEPLDLSKAGEPKTKKRSFGINE